METLEIAKPVLLRNDLLKSLSIPACHTPILSDARGVWYFPCGLALNEKLLIAKLERKAVRAARQAHYTHHQQEHKSHGIEWAIEISYKETKHGSREYTGMCPK